MLLREIELVGEPLEGVRLFHGVQVLALEVLDERHLERELFGNLPHDDRNARQRRPLRGAPPAFASDQLVAKADSAHDKRLNDSARADRARQLFESLLAETGPRLIGAGVNEIDIDLQ